MFGLDVFFSPISFLCCPVELLASSMYTYLSRSMAEPMSADKDNTTRKHVDLFHWKRTQLGVCLCCKFES